MSRRPRFCPPGYPIHVIHRGNDRRPIFTSDSDMAAYAHWLSDGARKYEVQVHAWVFMTNHVHLLLTPRDPGAVSAIMQFVGRLYVRRFNRRYTRTGTLFEGRFKSSVVEEDRYLLACLRYIELNPLRAGLAADPAEYRWSSHRCHVFGQEAEMWSPHPTYEALGPTAAIRRARYRALCESALPMESVARIRQTANAGLVLGSEDFRRRLEAMQG
jgi:putative transposase